MPNSKHKLQDGRAPLHYQCLSISAEPRSWDHTLDLRLRHDLQATAMRRRLLGVPYSWGSIAGTALAVGRPRGRVPGNAASEAIATNNRHGVIVA